MMYKLKPTQRDTNCIIAFVAILLLATAGPSSIFFIGLLVWLFIPWKEYILKFKHYMDKLEKEASNAS